MSMNSLRRQGPDRSADTEMNMGDLDVVVGSSEQVTNDDSLQNCLHCVGRGSLE